VSKITPDRQQMDRSNDPVVTAEMDEAAAEVAMESRRQRLTGSAVGVGSVDFDDPGAFDVGDSESSGSQAAKNSPGG